MHCNLISHCRFINSLCRSIDLNLGYSVKYRVFSTMTSNVPFVTFNNGLKCPIFGLGTWKSKPGEVTEAVKDAIDAGYRHIDTAFVYGNEKEVGEGIKAKIDDKTVKREDLFVTTKLWNTFHRKDLVLPSLQDSLDNLGLAYVDLYLIHWPMGYKEGSSLFPEEDGKTLYSTTSFLEAWPELEKAVDKGLVKSIGVSNFNSKQLEAVLNIARIKPVTNQVECHPYLNQRKLQAHCESKGIILTAYSPLGSPDRPWAKPTDLPMLEKPELKELADKYKKTSAQIVLRYQVERGNIVIPKSVTKSRIISNIDIFNFKLKPEDIKALDSFDCNERLLHLSHVKDHKEYPFNIEY